MSEAPISEADLQAFIDGRLAEARRAEVDAVLATQPELTDQVASYRAHNAALRAAFDPVLAEPVPVRLLDATRPRPRRAWAAAAALAWVALGGVGGWAVSEAYRPAERAPRVEAPLPLRAAIAHAVYAPEVRHPVEVGADQEAHLVAWLSKRLGAPVRAPKLESVGYRLISGRMLLSEAGPVT